MVVRKLCVDRNPGQYSLLMRSLLFRADLDGLSRRDFIKLTGFGLLSLFYLPKSNSVLPASSSPGMDLPCQGRVLVSQASSFETPSFTGRVIQDLKKDTVYNIISATFSEENPAHNHIWYQLEGGGYVHSANLQPMQIRLNPVENAVPAKGLPAEVTVPFTDAVWNTQPGAPFAYRLYYGAVLWIDHILKDEKGQAWYRVVDEGQGPIYYYARAEHLHLVNADELLPVSPEIPASGKRIDVLLKEQVVIAYENNIPVMMTKAATGAKFGQKDLSTPIGRYFTNYLSL